MPLLLTGTYRPMRILICAKNDLPANLAVNRLLPELVGHDIKLWLSNVEREQEAGIPDLRQLRFFERELPNQWLFPLLGSQTDRPPQDYAGYLELGRRHDIAVNIVTALDDPATLEDLRSFAPDVMISIRFSHIFRRTVLDVPRFGIINLHPGRLPDYAGLFTPMRQLLHGLDRLYCTMHWIDTGIDTGPILEVCSMPVQRQRSLFWHVANAYGSALTALLNVVGQLENGVRPPGVVQDRSQRRYFKIARAGRVCGLQGGGLVLVQTRRLLGSHGTLWRAGATFRYHRTQAASACVRIGKSSFAAVIVPPDDHCRYRHRHQRHRRSDPQSA